ncbi:hypothetical protein RHSIM_Rhsim12G0105800 [Rhododendron simsii]|uniref:Uncharacterized protein n=1 Tax=Rhododendron simsii TaxID=118357 RepID=A0A834G545_RHOSS|nr:hypothetical protein RHSIM_Rhsim12G0105800 [Rhododendron simsii]
MKAMGGSLGAYTKNTMKVQSLLQTTAKLMRYPSARHIAGSVNSGVFLIAGKFLPPHKTCPHISFNSQDNSFNRFENIRKGLPFQKNSMFNSKPTPDIIMNMKRITEQGDEITFKSKVSSFGAQPSCIAELQIGDKEQKKVTILFHILSQLTTSFVLLHQMSMDLNSLLVRNCGTVLPLLVVNTSGLVYNHFLRTGDSEQRSVARRAWTLIQRIEGIYKAASFGNLLIFLYTGRSKEKIERQLHHTSGRSAIITKTPPQPQDGKTMAMAQIHPCY